MDSIVYQIIAGLVGLILGIVLTRLLLRGTNKKLIEEAEENANGIIKEANINAENIKKEKIIEAKEKFLKMKSDFDEEVNRKKNQIIANENKVKQRDSYVSRQVEQNKRREAELESQKRTLETQLEILQNRKEDLKKAKKQQVNSLEKISNLSSEQAVEELKNSLIDEATTKASSYIKGIVEEAKLSASKEAKKIVIQTIQRTATEHAIENCVSIFNIESDDIKGKIIGREGRNIRALEVATGVEIIVDDTPESIIISGFNPIRREVARLSLHRLVTDGRIHPARIEEVVAKTTKNIEEEIIEIGERTVIDLGIHGLHPELIKMVGKMRFRSSYSQNLLQHSREVANLCATLATEFGLNAKIAKRAGLLHDIGKVWDEDPEQTHAIIGMEIAKKYNENKVVCNAIGAHHDEIEMTSLISPIVQACDAVSGARPGARREIMESYMKRLKNLETLALNFDGVQKCYAIQAGRELRVLVDADNVSDQLASDLSFQISQKIETDMQYPGQVKVTVIREMRAVNYAK